MIFPWPHIGDVIKGNDAPQRMQNVLGRPSIDAGGKLHNDVSKAIPLAVMFGFLKPYVRPYGDHGQAFPYSLGSWPPPRDLEVFFLADQVDALIWGLSNSASEISPHVDAIEAEIVQLDEDTTLTMWQRFYMRETKERLRNQLALARLVSLQFQDTPVGIERPPQVPSGRAKWALQWTLEWVARTGERLTAEACREYLCGMFPDVFTRPSRPTDGTFIAIKYNGNTWSKRTMQTKMSEARAAMVSGPAVKSDRQKRRREPRKRKKR